MLQLIGLVAALIASLLLDPSPAHLGSPVGISGGGPVGLPQPHPHATPTIVPRAPNQPH